MAILKNSTISESLRVTDIIFTDNVQTRIINIPVSSGNSILGPGENGQIIKSNGVSVYWGLDSSSITGIKGDKESSYRTGQINITPANIGAVAISQGASHAGKFLIVNASGNIEPTAL